MAKIEYSTTISQPLFEVFKKATDYDSMHTWLNDLTSPIGITAGKPVRAGTMMSMNRKFLGQAQFVNFDVVTFDRNKLIEWSGMWGRFPFKRRIEFTSQGRETAIKDVINVNVPIIFFYMRPFVNNGLKSMMKNEWNALEAQY